MAIEFDSNQPIYLQLVRFFSIRIASGEWKTGTRVMSVRDLAIEYGVNPNTVQRALSEMEREGMVYTERTSGRFITSDQDKIDQMRDGLVMQEINNFVSQMTALGCRREEWLALLKDNIKKEN